MLTTHELYEIAGYQSFVDEVCQVNPFLAVQDNSGSNGEEDVKFRRMLRTERFMVDLPEAFLLPKKHQKVFVIERLFSENYENIYISWTAKMADGSIQNPFHFIGMHETSQEQRRDPEDGIICIDSIYIPQISIDKFRKQASMMLSRAQHGATRTKKRAKIKEVNFDGEPTELKVHG